MNRDATVTSSVRRPNLAEHEFVWTYAATTILAHRARNAWRKAIRPSAPALSVRWEIRSRTATSRRLCRPNVSSMPIAHRAWHASTNGARIRAPAAIRAEATQSVVPSITDRTAPVPSDGVEIQRRNVTSVSIERMQPLAKRGV